MPCILHIQIQTYSFRVRLDSTSVYLYYMKYYAFIKTDNKPFVIPFRSNYCIGIDCVYFVHERVIIRDALSPLTAQTQVNTYTASNSCSATHLYYMIFYDILIMREHCILLLLS